MWSLPALLPYYSEPASDREREREREIERVRLHKWTFLMPAHSNRPGHNQRTRTRVNTRSNKTQKFLPDKMELR